MLALPPSSLRLLLLGLLLLPIGGHATQALPTDLSERLAKLETELAVYKAENKGELAQAQLSTSKDLAKQEQQLKDFADRQADFAARMAAQDAHIDNNLTTVGIVFGCFSALLTVAGVFGFFSLRSRAREEARSAATEWFAEKALQHERQLTELGEKLQAVADKVTALHERADSAQAEVDACASAALDGIGEKTAAFEQELAKAQQDLSAGKHITQTERLTVLQAGENSKSKSTGQLSWRDWNNRAFAAYANGDLADAVECWDRVAALPVTPTEQIAWALLNKGIVLGQQGETADALACYEQLLWRFSDATELALREAVAKALVNKGVSLGRQGDAIGELACYDQLLQRFSDAAEPALRELVAKALLNKGVVLGRQEDTAGALACYGQLLQRFSDAAEPALREPVAMALLNKGISLGQQGDTTGKLACYDQLLQRFSDAAEPALRKQVAMALVYKGGTLRQLGENADALACYDQLLQRFSDASESALREQVANAKNSKGFTLLCQAKQYWADQPQRLQLLQQASDLFAAVLDGCADSSRGMILGNQSYCAHLLESQPTDWVRVRMQEGLKLSGKELYEGTLADLAIHPVADKDEPFRRLLDEVWQQVQSEG